MKKNPLVHGASIMTLVGSLDDFLCLPFWLIKDVVEKLLPGGEDAKVVLDKEAYYKYCVYDSDISTGLGVGALLFLLLTQSLLMLVSKCFCCGRALRPGGVRVRAILLFITSWVTFIIAVTCLVAGSVRNAYHTRFVMFQDPLSCETLRKRVFGAGAVQHSSSSLPFSRSFTTMPKQLMTNILFLPMVEESQPSGWAVTDHHFHS